MIDYFALLQQPHRPWLDPDELKQKYQELTLATHPDRQATQVNPENASSHFASINEAYRVLSNPRLRLQHLLSLEGIQAASGTQPPPEEFTDLFLSAGALIHEIDRVLEKAREAENALSKSLLRSEILDKQKRARAIADQMQQLYESVLQELRTEDERWNEERATVLTRLPDLQGRLTYLKRWIEQIEERQFQLSV
jgi:curved DNA-binding protein CbpA